MTLKYTWSGTLSDLMLKLWPNLHQENNWWSTIARQRWNSQHKQSKKVRIDHNSTITPEQVHEDSQRSQIYQQSRHNFISQHQRAYHWAKPSTTLKTRWNSPRSTCNQRYTKSSSIFQPTTTSTSNQGQTTQSSTNYSKSPHNNSTNASDNADTKCFTFVNCCRILFKTTSRMIWPLRKFRSIWSMYWRLCQYWNRCRAILGR